MPKTKDELLNEIDGQLWLLFPDEKHTQGPNWQQEPYKSDWFDLCQLSFDIIHEDAFGEYVRLHWNIRRVEKLSEFQEQQLRKLIEAWGEWQYARRKISEESQSL